MPDSRLQDPDDAPALLEKLRARRKTLRAQAYDLAHDGRRLSDAIERQAGAAGSLEGRQRDLKSGLKLVEEELRALEREIAKFEAAPDRA